MRVAQDAEPRPAGAGAGPGRSNGHAGDPLDDELNGPPVLARRSPRVAEIVEAARRILEADGPGALTMRRVGGELGIRAPSLYKHFRSKAELEAAILEDALEEIGTASHEAVRSPEPLSELLGTYRRYAGAHPHLYRLATAGPLDRDRLTPGLEAWAGNPWFVVMGDPALAQALWSFAHGMVILELDGRYPPGSDLDATWAAGAAAFQAAARSGLAGTPSVAQTESRRTPAGRAEGVSTTQSRTRRDLRHS